MEQFVAARGLDQPERRVALAAGSPGLAVSLDLEAYDKRRAAMLALLKVAAGAGAVRLLGSGFRGHRPQQEREARSVSQGALRTAARPAAAARGRAARSATRISAANWKRWPRKLRFRLDAQGRGAGG